MHVRLPLDHFDMHSAFDIEKDKALSRAHMWSCIRANIMFYISSKTYTRVTGKGPLATMLLCALRIKFMP